MVRGGKVTVLLLCTTILKASVKCNNSNRSVSQYHAKCYQHSRTKSLFDIQAPLRLNSVTHSDVARRPQNFKKFPIFSKLLNKVKTMWEMFFKNFWSSQAISILVKCLFEHFCSSRCFVCYVLDQL